jgi:hypothetical protein
VPITHTLVFRTRAFSKGNGLYLYFRRVWQGIGHHGRPLGRAPAAFYDCFGPLGKCTGSACGR